ncbi:MAG: FlgD immunoglobulin-like domain containing protein [Candidatus Eisenbacteria bacterium]
MQPTHKIDVYLLLAVFSLMVAGPAKATRFAERHEGAKPKSRSEASLVSSAGVSSSTTPSRETVTGPNYRRSSQVLRYGHYTLIEGEPFAVEGETWTFDHADPDPLEGWRSEDLNGSAQNAYRRITATEWGAHNPVAAPIPAGSGAAWVGYYQDEALADGWSGGLGYGHNWCQLYKSPALTYDGTGDVDLSFLYFNRTEEDFDFTRVLLVLEDGTEVQLASFTGQIGSPPSSYPTFNRTITSAEFQGQSGFQIVFEMSSDESFDDQDGFEDTPYGPFGADNITLTNNIVEGDQLWDFEADDHGFIATQCGSIGALMDAHALTEYGGVECGLLSGSVLAFHNASGFHPEGQYEFAYSPAVSIAGVQPDSIWVEFSMYSVLPHADGVFFRPGWQYYPSTSGGSEWSERVGDLTWFFVADEPICLPYTYAATGIPAAAERVRFVYELRSDREAFGLPPCTVEPCNGNETPLVDDMAILLAVPSEAGSISGNVFLDPLADCGQDAPARSRLVLLEPEGKLATAAADGSYTFGFVAPGTHTVSLIDKPHWDSTCPLGEPSYDITLGSGDVVTDVDLGTRAVANVQDAAVFLSSTRARPGFKCGFVAEVRNIGTVVTDSVDLVLDLPAHVVFESATDGGDFVPSGGGDADPAGTVSWRLGGIGPDESMHVSVRLQVLPNTPLGFGLEGFLEATLVQDVDLVNNTTSHTETVVGSFDPNDKLVDPSGNIAADQILAYHINFQNVGTAEAIDVVVRDTLDANLDITTFAIGATSHPYTFEVVGREMIWTFTGIALPDSTSDEPGSHGFVEFTAQPIAGLFPGTQIANQAGIHFDFNGVVLTNEVVSTIEDPSGVPELGAGTTSIRLRSVRPNPTGEATTLQLFLPQEGRLSADVFGIDGRRVRRLTAGTVPAGELELHWDGRTDAGGRVAAGIYFVRFRMDTASGIDERLETRVVRLN